MKQYYNDITRENLDVIKAIQEKIADVRQSIEESAFITANLAENSEAMKFKLVELQQ